mmetsp:Transcript_10665/g.17405  ORF Transcript_10665/g.17405 Transcript_10665/m.17405 type:complete len:522 (+) Transcript_10665:497-2062(+)
MKAKLHCPHEKGYCVDFQAKFGTLKGIENKWHPVERHERCEWENQQHGRGHHLKVVVESPIPGKTFCVQLVHEDGSNAPAFTRMKTGSKKSTMLVGIDPRDWRMGLSWNSVVQEGPRKWHPASNCQITIGPPGSPLKCEGVADDKLLLSCPCDKLLVIPFRIEVLSAVKGAGNFSRYSVHMYETSSGPGDDPPSCVEGGWSWRSPDVLVEAKWLPAAPVRIYNKQRSRISREEWRSQQQQKNTDADAGDRVYGPISAGGGKDSMGRVANNSVQGGRGNALGHFSNVQDIVLTCRSLGSFLCQPSTFSLGDANLQHIDYAVQELQCALAKYNLERSSMNHNREMRRSSIHHDREMACSNALAATQYLFQQAAQQQQHHPYMPHFIPQQQRLIQTMEKDDAGAPARKYLPVQTKKRKMGNQKPTKTAAPPKKGSAEPEAKVRKSDTTKHDVLSSPPRGPKSSGLTPEMMAAITLPGPATGGGNHTVAANLGIHEKPKYSRGGANFEKFDMLAAAAVQKSSLQP